nr:DUF2080 family transposase-associated protein [uncultured Methanoregula sp.]
MSKVPVYKDGKVIARVEYNSKLDFWDGRNMTSGSVGRHLGYTKLAKSGEYVLIHGTQWDGEHDSAEIISAKDLLEAAARTNNLDAVLAAYPELKEMVEGEEVAPAPAEEIEVQVVGFGNGAHITLPKDLIGQRIRYKVVKE